MIQTHQYRAHCHDCGRFMSWEEAGTTALHYTPYGGYLDTEPPDEEYIHEKCWKTPPPSRKKLINEIAWLADNRIRQVGI